MSYRPETCPTCGSDDPRALGSACFDAGMQVADPWHDVGRSSTPALGICDFNDIHLQHPHARESWCHNWRVVESSTVPAAPQRTKVYCHMCTVEHDPPVCGIPPGAAASPVVETAGRIVGKAWWIDTELWNFAHALAIDLGVGTDREKLIHNSMRGAILAHNGAAEPVPLPPQRTDYVPTVYHTDGPVMLSCKTCGAVMKLVCSSYTPVLSVPQPPAQPTIAEAERFIIKMEKCTSMAAKLVLLKNFMLKAQDAAPGGEHEGNERGTHLSSPKSNDGEPAVQMQDADTVRELHRGESDSSVPAVFGSDSAKAETSEVVFSIPSAEPAEYKVDVEMHKRRTAEAQAKHWPEPATMTAEQWRAEHIPLQFAEEDKTELDAEQLDQLLEAFSAAQNAELTRKLADTEMVLKLSRGLSGQLVEKVAKSRTERDEARREVADLRAKLAAREKGGAN